MTSYVPDNWVVLKINGDDPHYRVLGGWSGGYLQGSSWRMNSGITRVEEDETYFKFFGTSGSVYYCHKDAYGVRMNCVEPLNYYEKNHPGMVEIMPEDTYWFDMDLMKAWIQTTPDFEYEVIDVYLGIKSMNELMHLKGFNEDEWREAEQFAKDVASVLGIEYIGEVGEAGHEMPEWSYED